MFFLCHICKEWVLQTKLDFVSNDKPETSTCHKCIVEIHKREWKELEYEMLKKRLRKERRP